MGMQINYYWNTNWLVKLVVTEYFHMNWIFLTEWKMPSPRKFLPLFFDENHIFYSRTKIVFYSCNLLWNLCFLFTIFWQNPHFLQQPYETFYPLRRNSHFLSEIIQQNLCFFSYTVFWWNMRFLFRIFFIFILVYEISYPH